MELLKGKQMDNEQPFMWYSFPEKSILQDLIELGSNNDWKSADPWNENQQVTNTTLIFIVDFSGGSSTWKTTQMNAKTSCEHVNLHATKTTQFSIN